ncbi:hypothetical protein PPACK8108_LOCUS9696 [Phakopsora pachyrhizi]|uniref:Secreted protein n=1 Tax=Phakopsora pachyrhizi TaxID=170000 RepID=A0AAV0AWY0_PHAPC|nr:hypothetical protein PPACK8108_LOCUS9696 [Phakopsora pachyrhizi]
MLKWVHTQLRLAKGAKGSSSADISLLLLISCSPLLVSNDLGLGPEVELKQTFFFSPCCLPRKYLEKKNTFINCSFRNSMCDNVYSDFAFYRISQKNEKVCCLRLQSQTS